MNSINLINALFVSIVVTVVSMLLIYWGFCAIHFGTGQVIIPDWQKGYLEGGLPEPIPVMEAVDYWKGEAKRYALIGGGSIFSLSLIGIFSSLVVSVIDKRKFEEEEKVC